MAIVGSRRCTPYGENIAYRAAYELGKRGVIIISGLAYGIDSCAHRGCLDAGGITMAVLGTAINNIYPRRNYGLAERILEKGAILSEYAPDTEARAYNFQIRNRIVSGLADAVLIVEASTHSGTKGTYNFAASQGKDIFAVPGDLSRPMSAGANEILRDGANPYLDYTDILVSLGLKDSEQSERDISHLLPVAQDVYRAIKSGVHHPDKIIEKLDIGVMDFNVAVTTLELDDLIVQDGAGWTICP